MTLLRRVFYCWILFVLLHGISFAAVEFKTVQSIGTGSTLKDAVNNALSEAIGRVNGLSLETKSQMNSIEISQVDNNNENYFAGESYKKSVKEATRGAVAGYDVVSQGQNDRGQWEVTLSVQVAKYLQSKIAGRKRIAVMPLRVSDRSFIIEGRLIDKTATKRIMGQDIVSALVQSRRFTVLDREYIRETVGEQMMITSGNVPVTEMARLGQELVADYILVGTLEDFNFKTSKINMQSSGRELTSRTGKVEISYRIIDIATRQIAFSEYAKFKITESDIKKVDSSFGLENIESILCMISAERIGKKILNAIYPVLVVSVSGETVVLGQGGSGIKQGETYDVFEYGNTMTDPYTKESIGREEIYAATIEVTRVNPKQSYAKIVKSERDLARIFQPKKLVCRIHQEAEDEAAVKRKKRSEEQKKRREQLDNDW